MTREKGNRQPVLMVDQFRQAPPSNGSDRNFRHHLTGGSRHSLSAGDTTPGDRDVKPDRQRMSARFLSVDSNRWNP